MTSTLAHFRTISHHPYDYRHHDSLPRTYQFNQRSSSRQPYPTTLNTSNSFSSAVATPPSGAASGTYDTRETYHGESGASYSSRGLYHEDSIQSRSQLSYADMPPVHSHTPTAPGDTSSQPSRKRRRAKEPDWREFYRNGLPEEIIVIDDSPEGETLPQRTASHQTLNSNSRRLPLPVPSHPPRPGPGLQDYLECTSDHVLPPVAKKQRRNNEPANYDPVYHNIYAGSHVPHERLDNLSTSNSTISSERTTSAAHNTAATSLESIPAPASVAQTYYDENEHSGGQKRKRTTRQQVAQETRRRQEELGDACLCYQPPSKPVKKVADVPVKVIPDHTYAKATDYDDEDGHYVVAPGSDLTEQYKIIKLLGQGTFGKVVQAEDRKRRGHYVAIKVIRSVQKYRDASRIELRVLATLKANDATNRNRCIHFRECFDYRGHICIVMDLLGQSVFDFLKGNNFVPFPNSHIQSFARQLFTSVAFLHDLNLIHTDLKPENILLCSSQYQTFTYNRSIPSASTTTQRSSSTRRVLLDTEIRLIDFGSATFQDEYHSSVVSTRHYRAPEIILGLGWSYPCDIWSIGCILVELFTGDALFQTHDNLEHLAMMEAVVNQRIDSHLVQQVNRMRSNGGNAASKYFKRLKLDYPQSDTSRASRKFVKCMKRLDDIVVGHGEYYEKFRDLLKKIFVYDPARRITAKEALQHPWFKMVCSPDDGTEAIKIRQEKLRQQESFQNEQEERNAREAKRPRYAGSGGSTHDYYSGNYQHRADLGTDLAPIRLS